MSEKNGNGKKAEFGTPQKVFEVCEDLQKVENLRALDRARINTLFNGQTPYTAEEVQKYKIQVNVNWGLGKRIMIDANRQMNNALLHSGTLFTCTPESGDEEKRDKWSHIFTRAIHVPMQRGRSGKKNHFVMRSRNAAVCMHGIGPLLWSNAWDWMPRFVPLEDLLIPTDTFCDYSNLRYFAVNLYLTPSELVEMTQGAKVQKQWNQTMVREILDNMRGRYSDGESTNWRDQPEAMAEVWKQNQGYYHSDKVPKVKMRSFYFRQVDEPRKWYRHVILREAYGKADKDKFIYDGGDEPFANDVDHILHTQFGDSNYVAPLKYHAVRGLGVDQFAPTDTMNRLQCQFVQHVFEQLCMYFRIQDPADRDRLKQVTLSAYGYIPEGLNIVKREERHQIDAGLVQMAMAQMRQISQESSVGYVSDPNDGTNKERTAFEVQANLNQSNVMVNGMLQTAYMQEGFLYEELVRRFCQQDSPNKQVKAFHERCKEIPDDILFDHTKWRVMPERVLGGGDKTMAQAQSQWLLEHKTLFDPAAQQKILRLATTTVLDDPAKGALFVPDAPPQASAGAMAAAGLFGTMMQGVSVPDPTGIDQQGYIAALLAMMAQVVQTIMQTDGVGTLEQIIGLQIVAQNTAKHIMIVAEDESQKQLVKQFGDALGQIMNSVKAMSQRLMEQQQQGQQQQGDPAAQAKAQSTMAMAQIKMQINKANADMKRQMKALDFQMNQQMEMMKTVADIKRQDLKARQDLMHQSSQNSLAVLGEIRQGRTKQMVAEKTAGQSGDD